MNNTHTYSNDWFKIYKKDGILYLEYTWEIKSLTLEMAKMVVREKLKVSNGRNHMVLVDIRKVRKWEKPVRDYFGSGDGVKYISAGAFIISNKLQLIAYKFFTMVSKKSPVPTQFFTNYNDAEKWLRKQKKDPEQIS